MKNIIRFIVKTPDGPVGFEKEVPFQLTTGAIIERSDCPPGRLGTVLIGNDHYRAMYDTVIPQSEDQDEQIVQFHEKGFTEFDLCH